jgi:hypothetical protein
MFSKDLVQFMDVSPRSAPRIEKPVVVETAVESVEVQAA